MGAYLCVGLGGILGANARYAVSTLAASRLGLAFPYGTFVVNATGSLLMGLFLTAVADHVAAEARLFVATGFLGAYTTFSTFAYETIALARRAEVGAALANALGSAAVGVAGATLGILLADGLGGRLG